MTKLSELAVTLRAAYDAVEDSIDDKAGDAAMPAVFAEDGG